MSTMNWAEFSFCANCKFRRDTAVTEESLFGRAFVVFEWFLAPEETLCVILISTNAYKKLAAIL